MTWGIPSVAVTNYSGFGDDSEGPYANDNNSLQFIDNFSWIRGKHSFRFGGEFRRDRVQPGRQSVCARRVPLRPRRHQHHAERLPATRVGGDAFADFLLGYSKRSEAAVQIAAAQFRNTSYGVLRRRRLEGQLRR